jgi:hypothetical protein
MDLLRPDDLLLDHEPRLDQSVEHLARVQGGMPDISDLCSGERVGGAPVGTVVVQQRRRTGAARGLPDPVPPTVVDADSVRRVGREQRHLLVPEQPGDLAWVGCVAAEQPMRAKLINLAGPGPGFRWRHQR